MSIEITQTCNGCGKTRIIANTAAHRDGGWRELNPNVHLCAECVSHALASRTTSDEGSP